MADLPLACLFGGALCLYQAAGGRRGGFYAVALPLAVLAMTKDIGLAYGLIAVFLIGVDQLFGTQQPEGWRRLRVFGYRLARTALLAVPVLGRLCQLEPLHGRHGPRGGQFDGRQRADELRRGTARRGAPAARHRAGSALRRTDADDGAGACVPPRLPAGPARRGAGAGGRAVAAGVFRRAQGRAAPPCRGGLFRLCVLLCGAVPFPSDPLFLQFLRDRSRRPQGLRALPDAVFAGLDGGRAVPAGPVRRGGPGAHAAPPPGAAGRRPGGRRFFGGVCLARRAPRPGSGPAPTASTRCAPTSRPAPG